jgi:hypothetical protein
MSPDIWNTDWNTEYEKYWQYSMICHDTCSKLYHFGQTVHHTILRLKQVLLLISAGMTRQGSAHSIFLNRIGGLSPLDSPKNLFGIRTIKFQV